MSARILQNFGRGRSLGRRGVSLQGSILVRFEVARRAFFFFFNVFTQDMCSSSIGARFAPWYVLQIPKLKLAEGVAGAEDTDGTGRSRRSGVPDNDRHRCSLSGTRVRFSSRDVDRILRPHAINVFPALKVGSCRFCP